MGFLGYIKIQKVTEKNSHKCYINIGFICWRLKEKRGQKKQKGCTVHVCVVSVIRVRGTPLLLHVISLQRRKGKRGQAWKRGGDE